MLQRKVTPKLKLFYQLISLGTYPFHWFGVALLGDMKCGNVCLDLDLAELDGASKRQKKEKEEKKTQQQCLFFQK